MVETIMKDCDVNNSGEIDFTGKERKLLYYIVYN
jgi:hypothetical protein